MRELPHSFWEALRIAKNILSSNAELVAQNRVDPEAEQLVLAAYRTSTGEQLSRIEFFSRIQDRFPESAAERLLILAGSRAEGRPLQHLTGFQVFLDHEYEVGPEVLIPRPETEVLLIAAVAELASKQITPKLGLEIGLGSGILSIELLARYPELFMVATEYSQTAYDRAQKNAEKILGTGLSGVQRLSAVRVEDSLQVWEPFQKILPSAETRADFLISNPPYLTQGDSIDEDVLKFEPHEALFSPTQDPLFFYRAIADKAGAFIKEEGYVFAEMPHERASEIVALFPTPLWNVEILPDLNQRDRVLIARLKGKNG